MTEQLKGVLKYLVDFNEQELNTIAACFKPLKAKKNTLLLLQGEVCKAFYFVHKGSIRTYYITRQGEEKTRYVMLGNHIGTALTSFINQQPSFETIDALEDSELLLIYHHDFYRLLNELPRWKEFYQTILEMAYTFQNKKLESIVTLTAKQRYQQLLKENPALVQQLSNKMLASYLDIRPETMSRIKSNSY